MPADEAPSTSLSLLLRVRDRRDEDAWRQFVQAYNPVIIAWCRKRGLQSADAQDVAQGLLEKLVRHMQTFQYDPQQRFRAWLNRVTRNAVIDFVRKQQRQPATGTGDMHVRKALEDVPAPGEGEPSASDELVDQLTSRMHRELFGEAEQRVRPRVQARTWAAYQARRKGDLARDVASRLGMRVAAVHKAKSRVVQLIRAEIGLLIGPEARRPAVGE